MSLIEQLAQRQEERKLSDEAFAARLAISRPYWSLVRAGKRQPGPRFFRGVLREFPEFASECLKHLRDLEPVS